MRSIRVDIPQQGLDGSEKKRQEKVPHLRLLSEKAQKSWSGTEREKPQKGKKPRCC